RRAPGPPGPLPGVRPVTVLDVCGCGASVCHDGSTYVYRGDHVPWSCYLRGVREMWDHPSYRGRLSRNAIRDLRRREGEWGSRVCGAPWGVRVEQMWKKGNLCCQRGCSPQARDGGAARMRGWSPGSATMGV